MTPPILTDADREALGMYSHLIHLCELELRHGPQAWIMWWDLPEEQKAKYRRIAISGLNAARHEKRVVLTNAEYTRRVAQIDRQEAARSDAQIVRDAALDEQWKILLRAEDRQHANL